MENVTLRQQLIILKRKARRPRLTDVDRNFLVCLSRQWKEWKSALIIVQPDTVLKWHKNLSRKIWADKCARPPGRKPLDKSIVELIRRMAIENITWGTSRIHGELLKLGIKISERTVATYLPKDRPTSPTCNHFLKSHAKGIISLDLFTVSTASFKMLHGLVVIDHDRRKILLTNATYFPSEAWVTQQVLKALPGENSYNHLIVDNDSRFSKHFVDEIDSMLDIRVVKTSIASPWQNAIVERVIGTFRKECLDHHIVVGDQHLRELLADFTQHYNEDRTHMSLDKDSPESRRPTPQPAIVSRIIREQRVTGLHSRYKWSA